jgi:hypothetical protein
VDITGLRDVTGLRDAVLQQAAKNLNSAAVAIAQEALVLNEPTAAESWGIEVMVVPDMLARHVVELGNGSGWLITCVYPNSPADRSGLRKGWILVDVDHRRLTKDCSLPKLVDRPLSLAVLTNEGLKRAAIQPDPRWLEQVENEFASHRAVRFPNIITRQPGGGSCRSLSVAEINGKLSIAAVVSTSNGERDVRLQGTRAEVETQLESLPHDIQSKLRPEIGF